MRVLALGSLVCFYCGAGRGNLFAGETYAIAVAYYVMAISLNLLVTAMFLGRILAVGWHRHGEFGPDVSREFFCTASLLVESALPRAVIGTVFLVTFALDHGASAAFLSLYIMLTVGTVYSSPCNSAD